MPEKNSDIWLERAEDAFTTSTSYIDTNYRVKWEDNIRHHQSKHKTSSKYTKTEYAGRSKLFVPKTRTSVRTNEAAAATVFFSNQDLVSIEARNQNDIRQVISADINRELVNYRLTESIPWFTTLIGAFQDAQVVGVVCSYQYWKYEEKDIKYDMETIDPLTGEATKETTKDKKTVCDKPCIDLRPIENIRFHPSADWRDPIGTSPYVIDMLPMYAYEVKAMAKKKDPKTGMSKWKSVTDGELQVAKKQTYDTTAATRDNEREDKTSEASGTVKDYDIVWVHRNIMMDDGGDVVFYTLATSKMLTDPVPIEDEYPHLEGKRPYTMGMGAIEAHKVLPDSPVEMSTPLQQAINENKNQRQDNVALVLNKRYVVKNGAQVNLKSLVSNVPGSVTLANDPTGDIRTLDFDDVTGSSYQEQDRMYADFDGLVGAFSTSSVSTNRKLNETVGGMNLIKGGANSLTEYLLMTFTETWVEPTLKQLVKLIQYYETDETVLAIAAEKAKLWQRYQVGQVSDDVMRQDLQITLNVGFGSTDTQQKLEKFLFGVTKAVEIHQMIAAMPGVKIAGDEITKEIFGKLGYKDGTRFFPEQEEGQQNQAQLQQAMQMIQQLQAQLQDKQADREVKLQQVQIQEQGKNKRDAAKGHIEMFKEFNKDLHVEDVGQAMGGING